MESEFYTIIKSGNGEYREKGSRFIGMARHVKRKKEIQSFLKSVKKEHHKARHHCYAYLLDQNDFKANDDGEPKHSAGDPILGKIRSKQLSNVLVVVTRYFGGTKLGISGLVNAYGTAANNALENSIIGKQIETRNLSIVFDYKHTAHIERMVKEFDIKVASREFEDKCTWVLHLAGKSLKDFKNRIEEFNRMGLKIKMREFQD